MAKRIKLRSRASARDCGCNTHTARPKARLSHLVAATGPVGQITWSGVLVLENTMTGDGRLIEPGALRWENLPIPLRWVRQDSGMHDGAVVVGRILTMTRSGSQIKATGDFDAGSADGLEAARQVDEGLTNGVSVDLDDVSFEIRVAKDVLQEMDPFVEPDDANEPAQEPETDDEGRITVISMNADDEVMVTTDARVRAATMVAVPAFAEARIDLDAPLSEVLADAPPGDEAPADSADGVTPDGDPCSCTEGDPDYDPDCDCSGGEDDQEPPASAASNAQMLPPSPKRRKQQVGPKGNDLGLAAGAYPIEPPLEWFQDPGLTEPTPLTITSDGRVYGHLAVWGTCHAAFQGQCVTPPRSNSGYSYFRTGSVITREGSEISVGHLTLDTLHAGKQLGAADTIAHYEHTGRAAADVAAGDDEIGIWVAGALRPNVTEEQVRALRASPLSGDWRRIGGSLELVAALAVNVPGFPVPRPQGMVASGGVTTALIASGMVPPRRVIAPGHPGALSADDLRYLKRLADRERREEQLASVGINDQAAALARKVRASRLASRVHARR